MPCVCRCLHVCAGACMCVQVPAVSERVEDSLDLELQVVLRHLVWALETELGCSTGAEVLLAAEPSLLSWTSTLTPELSSASHQHRLGKMKAKYKIKAGIYSITTWFWYFGGRCFFNCSCYGTKCVGPMSVLAPSHKALFQRESASLIPTPYPAPQVLNLSISCYQDSMRVHGV